MGIKKDSEWSKADVSDIKRAYLFTLNRKSYEVITPISYVKVHLDRFPSYVWSNPNIRFLDPCVKSGEYLKEIFDRLMMGLISWEPNEEKRKNHIFNNMIYGIAVDDGCYNSALCVLLNTNLYKGERDSFYKNGIPEEWINLKFDVIVGNPPYQENDGGAKGSATPVYYKFIEKALELDPEFLSFVIPSTWYNGLGKGGKDFKEWRKKFMSNRGVFELIDYENPYKVFSKVINKGGLCVFVYNKNHHGKCVIKGGLDDGSVGDVHGIQNLDSDNMITRGKYSRSIKEKANQNSGYLDSITHSRNLFKLEECVIERGGVSVYDDKCDDNQIRITTKDGDKWVDINDIKYHEVINKWKVVTSKASDGKNDKNGQRRTLSIIRVLPPGFASTESYIIIGSFDTEAEAKSLESYLKTKTVRFLIYLIAHTHNITKGKFKFVPIMNWNELWNDEKLYSRFGFNNDEIEYIESKIREH